jgi:CBS domain-containing protein
VSNGDALGIGGERHSGRHCISVRAYHPVGIVVGNILSGKYILKRRPMSIGTLIIRGVETAGPSTTAEALALRMSETGIGSIVIEEEMRPVGVVTDRDLAIRVDSADRDASVVTAEEIMTPDPVTVDEEAGLYELTQQMSTHSVRRMPVTNQEGKLVGIITLDDVVQLLSRELSNLADVIDAESPPY